jgi:predicted metal-dependent peptidase
MGAGRYLFATQEILNRYPFYSSVVESARFVEDPKIDTACISPELEIRYNPVFLDKLKNKELVFVVLHEFLHFLNNHFKRSIIMDSLTISNAHLKNVAMDLEINSFIVNKLKFKPFNEGLFPSNFGFEENLTAEDYLGLLMGRVEFIGLDGDSLVSALEKRSGKDIIGTDLAGITEMPDTYKVGKTLEDSVMLNDEFHESIAEKVEGDMKDHGIGYIGGGTASSFRNITIPKKRYKWKDLIKRIVSHTQSVKCSGYNRFSYGKISKRHCDSDLLFPSYYEEKMEVKLLLMMDISGSMYKASVEMLGYLKNLIHTIERADEIKIKIKLLFADADVVEHKFFDVESVDKITAIPDGGDNSTKWLEFVRDSKEKFDCILIWTDCYTPWIEIPGNITVLTFSDIDHLPEKCRPPYKTFMIRE